MAQKHDKAYYERLEELGAKAPWWWSCRLNLGLIVAIGFVNVYALRVNISVGIVCMVNHTALRETIHQRPDLPYDNVSHFGVSDASSLKRETSTPILAEQVSNNDTHSKRRSYESSQEPVKDGDFAWDKDTQGLILGCFYYGYMMSNILGGVLADKFGGKKVFAAFMALSTLGTFLTPLAARTGDAALIVTRILVGVGSGALFPVIISMWGYWAAPLERTKMMGFTLSGAMLGNVVTMPISGLLCEYGFDGGWPSVFYVFGISAALWLAVWMLFVSDYPSTHPRISAIEREYIEHSLQGQVSVQSKKQKTPWLKLLTSPPTWAIIVANVTGDWGLYVFVSNTPTYLFEDLKFDISSNGAYSALPFLALWFTMFFFPMVVDRVLATRYFTVTTVRKVCFIIGSSLPTIFLVGLAFVDSSHPILAVVILTLGVGSSGIMITVYGTNPMDIAPRYAGTIFGMSNMAGCISGFLSPSVVAALTSHQTHAEWQQVFFVTGAVYMFGALFYSICGSGELQPWAQDDGEDQETSGLLLADNGKSSP